MITFFLAERILSQSVSGPSVRNADQTRLQRATHWGAAIHRGHELRRAAFRLNDVIKPSK